MRVVLPAAMPEIFVGVRTGLVLALITMVTSEMIARQAGVGNILFNSLDMALYDTVYAMIVIIGVLGFILDVLFERLRAWLLAWAEPVHDSDRHVMSPPARSPKSSRHSAIVLILALGRGPASTWRHPRCCRRRWRVSHLPRTRRPHLSRSCRHERFRLFAGFAIALVVGVTLGVAATGNRTIEVSWPGGAGAGARPKIALYRPSS